MKPNQTKPKKARTQGGKTMVTEQIHKRGRREEMGAGKRDWSGDSEKQTSQKRRGERPCFP